MIQTQENGEKPHFTPGSGPLCPNSGCQFFFSKIWLRHSLDKQPITGSFKPLCENKNFMKNNISANLCSFWHPQ